MANGLQTVRPGDLITAQLFNDLLVKIEDLEQRIEVLEGDGGIGTGPLALTGRIPETGPYRIGDTLTLLGRNFEYSLNAARVFLNGVRVSDFASGSSDTRLVFVIPPISGVTEPATEVSLRVTNRTDEVTDLLLLRPALPAMFGTVELGWLSVSPLTFNPNDVVAFQFTITSRASQAADFLIDPVVGVAIGQNTWQDRIRVLDASLNPITNRVIHLDPLQQRTFHVQINGIPAGTASTPFTLTVNASAGGVIGTSGALPFQVGQAVDPPDTTITLHPIQSIPAPALVGDTVTAVPGQPSVRVRFVAEFELAGVYDLDLPLAAGTTGWTVARFATTPASFTIQASDIPAGGKASRSVEITISPAAGASASGRVEVRLRRQGASGQRSFSLNLNKGA
jgi:hypothetical protein